MISPDDKRLGARPARPQQGWIALMTKKLRDLRRVALRREIWRANLEHRRALSFLLALMIATRRS